MAQLQDGKWIDNGVFTSPTRAEYLNKTVSFEDFYRAIAKDAGISFAGSDILPRVKRALASGDEHLNTIPLATWDIYAGAAKHATAPAFKAHGDSWSIAGGVCVAKQAAKDAAEGVR